MSQGELVTAYASGRLSRRSFISGLTALGVSASAATAYATVLHPAQSAVAQQHTVCDELYPPQLVAPMIPIPPNAPPQVQQRLEQLQDQLTTRFENLQAQLNQRFAALRTRFGCPPAHGGS